MVAVADLGPPGAPAFLEPEHEANVRPGELVLSWTEAEDPDGDLLFYSVELRPFGVEDDSEDEDVARGLGDDDDSAADDDDADGDDDDSAGGPEPGAAAPARRRVSRRLVRSLCSSSCC